MVIVSSSKRFGEPLSVTRTVRVKLPGPWASVGVHVNTPVAGAMLAPAGGAHRPEGRGSFPLTVRVTDVALVHGDGDCLLIEEVWRAVVGDAYGQGEASRPLGLGRRPCEYARRGVDAGAGGCADQAKGQRVGRQVV